MSIDKVNTVNNPRDYHNFIIGRFINEGFFPCKFILLQSILVLSFFIFPVFKTEASCTWTGPNNSSYTYTAATISGAASLGYPSSWSCTNEASLPAVSPWICIRTTYTGRTSAVNGRTLPFTVRANAGGLYSAYPAISGLWYGPGWTSSTNNTLKADIAVSIPLGAALSVPAGIYTATVSFDIDMQDSSGLCEGGVGWDYGSVNLTFNFVVPTYCAINTINSINFGQISNFGTSTKNYDANGSVTTTCNPDTNYTIYLSDGKNRIPGGYRRMQNGTNFLPYQLYKNSSYSQIWDNTGGTSAIGGSGGVSSIGTASTQVFTVYGRIPQGINIPSVTGVYSDDVVVTVTY